MPNKRSYHSVFGPLTVQQFHRQQRDMRYKADRTASAGLERSIDRPDPIYYNDPWASAATMLSGHKALPDLMTVSATTAFHTDMRNSSPGLRRWEQPMYEHHSLPPPPPPLVRSEHLSDGHLCEALVAWQRLADVQARTIENNLSERVATAASGNTLRHADVPLGIGSKLEALDVSLLTTADRLCHLEIKSDTLETDASLQAAHHHVLECSIGGLVDRVQKQDGLRERVAALELMLGTQIGVCMEDISKLKLQVEDRRSSPLCEALELQTAQIETRFEKMADDSKSSLQQVIGVITAINQKFDATITAFQAQFDELKPMNVANEVPAPSCDGIPSSCGTLQSDKSSDCGSGRDTAAQAQNTHAIASISAVSTEVGKIAIVSSLTAAQIAVQSQSIETMVSDVKDFKTSTDEAVKLLEGKCDEQKATIAKLENETKKKVSFADGDDYVARLAAVKLQRFEAEKVADWQLTEQEDSIFFALDGNLLGVSDHLYEAAETISRPRLDKPPPRDSALTLKNKSIKLDVKSGWLFKRWLDKRSLVKNDHVVDEVLDSLAGLSMTEFLAASKFLDTKAPGDLMIPFHYYPR